jgi:hypothetical protein
VDLNPQPPSNAGKLTDELDYKLTVIQTESEKILSMMRFEFRSLGQTTDTLTNSAISQFSALPVLLTSLSVKKKYFHAVCPF